MESTFPWIKSGIDEFLNIKCKIKVLFSRTHFTVLEYGQFESMVSSQMGKSFRENFSFFAFRSLKKCENYNLILEQKNFAKKLCKISHFLVCENFEIFRESFFRWKPFFGANCLSKRNLSWIAALQFLLLRYLKRDRLLKTNWEHLCLEEDV